VGRVFRGGTQALADVSLALEPGEFVSLLGPSGCGKSTLLRIVAGLLEPSAGTLDWGLAGDRRSQVSFAFQDATLLPWATVTANVALPLRLLGSPRADIGDRVREAIELVGLGGFASVYPRQLSGGMRMRVSLARALVTRPRLLLLDEPFAALDEITRFKLCDDLLRLWQAQGFSVLFVTHSVFESAFLSQRVLVMSPRPGRVAADVAIDLPHPRQSELRTAPEYARCCRALSLRLAAVMAA
jgi:NitT/TauT family transport system ATP-binding protein